MGPNGPTIRTDTILEAVFTPEEIGN